MKRPFGKKNSTQTNQWQEENTSRIDPYLAMNKEKERYEKIMQDIRDQKIQTKEELLDAFASFLEFITIGKSIENQLSNVLTKKHKPNFSENDKRLQELLDVLQETPDPDRWHTEEESKESRRNRWRNDFYQEREHRQRKWEKEKQKKGENNGRKQEKKQSSWSKTESDSSNKQQDPEWYFKNPEAYAMYLSLNKNDKDLFERHNGLYKFILKYKRDLPSENLKKLQKEFIYKEVQEVNKLSSKDNKDFWRQIVKIYHPDTNQSKPQILQKLYEMILKELQIFQPKKKK